MYDLEIYAKYREREMSESVRRRVELGRFPRKQRRLSLTVGKALTRIGLALTSMGTSLLQKSSMGDHHRAARSLHHLSE